MGKEPVFSNRRTAFQSLEDAGFKLSSAKFYRDCSSPGKEDGLVRVNADGSINEIQLREYSKTLDRIEGDIQDLKDTQSLKAKKEVEKLDEQIKKIRFDREKDEGKYVKKEEVDEKIIALLTVLDVHFRQLIDMNMTDVCRILNGDLKRMNDAKDHMEQLVDEMLNKLATADSFSLKYDL